VPISIAVSSRRALAVGLAVASLWLLEACSKSDSADLLAQGQAAMARNEPAAAVLLLKGYVQAQPDSHVGRLALGRALLADGDASGAVVELERAASRGAQPGDVAVPLARAYLESGRPKVVIERFGSTSLPDPASQSDLRLHVAVAHQALGALEAAKSNLQQALRDNPANERALLAQARLTAAAGDLDSASAQVNRLISDKPDGVDARQLKGEILLIGRADVVSATAEFEAALTHDPRYMPAHKALIDIALRRGDLELLGRRVDALAAALPAHPETLLAQGQLALAKGDIPLALERSERLLQLAPDDGRVLFLAGLVQLRANRPIVAEGHLVKAVQQAPGVAEFRRALASLLVRNGDAVRALDTLAPLVAGTSADQAALQLAGQAELQRGRVAEAESMFRRAIDASAGRNAEAARSLAQVQIARGNVQQGLGTLERLAQGDTNIQSDLVLIANLLSRGEVDRALKAVAALEAKAPALPVAAALRARIALAQGNTDAAKASFERALALDAGHYPAVLGLAELDLAGGRTAAARARLEEHLKAQPRNYAALLRVVQLRVSIGVPPGETRALLEQAVRNSPGDTAPRLLLVDFLLTHRDVPAARTVAQQAVAAIPDDADLLDALGRVLLQAADPRQAVAAFGQVAALQPGSVRAHLRLGDAQIRAGDLSAGRNSLERARQIDPTSAEALQAVVNLAMAEKRFSDALAMAREQQRREPRQPLGFLLEADVLLNQRKLPESARAMRDAFDRQPSSPLAVRLHALHLASGRTSDADRFAADWQRSNPRDAEFIAHLGSAAIQRSDFAGSERLYRRVLDLRPDDPTALNNLAWSLVQQRKPEALVHARRANQIVVNQPQMMNTLATALRNDNQLSEAIEWQRKSVAASSGEPRYRLALAEMLVSTGDKAGAREELRVLEGLGENFPQRDRVLELSRAAR
jgi:putative PEP-CTERM system TPR-repeat lipoprotein